MIYVYGKSTSITSIADIQIGSQMAVDFQIIAKTRDVIEAAAADIDVKYFNLDNLDINVEAKDYVMLTLTFKALKGTATEMA